jgi:organic radical activating enzyme
MWFGMKYKINEIFYSIQGEGFYTGTPAVFIRFSGCNLNCDFCDTAHESYKEYNIKEIYDKIKSYPSKRIVLTGGEPFLQTDKALVNFLHSKDYLIHCETNGSINKKLDIDWLTVSPKKNWKLKTGNELKVVYHGQNLSQYLDSKFNYYYLQPMSMQNIKKTINTVKENPKWSLSVQIQKLLKVK